MPAADGAASQDGPLAEAGRAGPTERRLALVLNGGISLAVWMGGVTHEIENLRRASNGLDGSGAGSGSEADRAEARLADAWRDAARQRNERITVDVIGGTSAGGLNGVFLATAIARGASLGVLRRLWVDEAQLSPAALLQPQRPRAASLLNGEYFLDRIGAALDAIGPVVASAARPVSLTTTASAYGGLPRTVRDSSGGAFAEPDHRRRYRFQQSEARIRYRPERRDDPFDVEKPGHREFDIELPATREALAVAARATASVPVAFRPVEETAALRARRVWPPWPTREPGDATSEWLLDGGLLDNSPFEPVLELVTKQTVASVWKRTVCLVVPSGAELEVGSHEPGADPRLPPPWPSVALHGLLGLPGESDFRDDMELLGALMHSGRTSLDMQRFRSLIAHPDSELDGVDGVAQSARRSMRYYRQSRATAGVLEAIQLVQQSSATALMSPTRSPAPDVVLGAPRLWLPTALPGESVETDGPWMWGLAAADRFARLLLRTTRDRLDVPDRVRAELDDRLHRIGAVRKAVEEEIVTAARPATAWDPDDAEVAALIDHVYQRLRVPEILGSLTGAAVRTFTSAMPGTLTALQVLRAGLSLEVLDGAPGLPVVTRTTPIFDFVRFGIGPVPRVLGGADDDQGRTGRLLYGTRLGRFAAFGRPDWRAWDWMWGRIHAAVHLGRLLEIADDRLDAIVLDIITAEGTTRERVMEIVPTLLDHDTDPELLQQLWADGRLADTADRAFDLLGDPEATNPPMPAVVQLSGGLLAALLARVHRGRPRHLFLRLVAWFPRRLLWTWLGR